MILLLELPASRTRVRSHWVALSKVLAIPSKTRPCFKYVESPEKTVTGTYKGNGGRGEFTVGAPEAMVEARSQLILSNDPETKDPVTQYNILATANFLRSLADLIIVGY